MHNLLDDDTIGVIDFNKILRFLERNVNMPYRNEDIKSAVDIVE